MPRLCRQSGQQNAWEQNSRSPSENSEQICAHAATISSFGKDYFGPLDAVHYVQRSELLQDRPCDTSVYSRLLSMMNALISSKVVCTLAFFIPRSTIIFCIFSMPVAHVELPCWTGQQRPSLSIFMTHIQSTASNNCRSWPWKDKSHSFCSLQNSFTSSPRETASIGKDNDLAALACSSRWPSTAWCSDSLSKDGSLSS